MSSMTIEVCMTCCLTLTNGSECVANVRGDDYVRQPTMIAVLYCCCAMWRSLYGSTWVCKIARLCMRLYGESWSVWRISIGDTVHWSDSHIRWAYWIIWLSLTNKQTIQYIFIHVTLMVSEAELEPLVAHYHLNWHVSSYFSAPSKLNWLGNGRKNVVTNES